MIKGTRPLIKSDSPINKKVKMEAIDTAIKYKPVVESIISYPVEKV